MSIINKIYSVYWMDVSIKYFHKTHKFKKEESFSFEQMQTFWIKTKANQ